MDAINPCRCGNEHPRLNHERISNELVLHTISCEQCSFLMQHSNMRTLIIEWNWRSCDRLQLQQLIQEIHTLIHENTKLKEEILFVKLATGLKPEIFTEHTDIVDVV